MEITWAIFPAIKKTVYCSNISLVETLVTNNKLALTILVTAIDAQWEGMGDVGLARYEPALLPPCLTIRVLSYSIRKVSEIQHCKG